MGILSGSGGSANFDRQLESSTSQMQLEPNWASILEICDCIRQKDVTPKYAVTSIKKKIFDRNPHVSKFALVVIEACMKNCGSPLHDEVATKEFMEELRTLVKTASEPVKEQTLSIIQAWNKALGKKPNYKIIQDTFNLLTMEGYSFPTMNESDAMFSADTAPEWDEGEVCHLCRVKFSTFTRQHHCRCCGQVFCSKCSAKNSIIPKYGIEREVRVCDSCYHELNPSSGKEKEKKTKSEEEEGDLPAEYLASALSKEAQIKPKTSAEEIKVQEEEEFQLAMALSLSAAEVVEPKGKFSSISGTTSNSPYTSHSIPSYSEPKKAGLYTDVVADSRRAPDTSDPELSRYLNREYWERRKEERSLEPSAPVALHEPEETQINYRAPQNNYVEPQDEEEENSDTFVQTMENSLDMFIERMQNVTARGKHIAMDTTVQSLFQSLSAMHPQLMKLIEDEDDSKAKYEAMLQKLSLLREARESLDDMRNQHRQKLRQQELEQEMLRRMQMEQKLELMRQQKQEYLEYQRQLQIQRQQEMEAQQQFKFEQRQMIRIQPQAYQYQQSEGGTYPEPQSQYPDQYPSQATTSGYMPEQVHQGPPSYVAAVGNQFQMQQQGQISGGTPQQQPSTNMTRLPQDTSLPSGNYGQIPQNQHPMPQHIAGPQPIHPHIPGPQSLPQQAPGPQQLSQHAYQQSQQSQHPQQSLQQHQPQQLQQQQQKAASDLLDAPIGSEVYSQPPSYQDNGSQQLPYNQQNAHQQQYPSHQLPQSHPSYQQLPVQQQPPVLQQQQQPPVLQQQQQYPASQQHPQQAQPPQQSSMPPQQQYQHHQQQQQQQPATVNGPPSMQPQYPMSSDSNMHPTNVQGQVYPPQQQSQSNQQSEISSQYQQLQQQNQQPPIPSQYTHLQPQQPPQGPTSLQYIPPHGQGSSHHGPASLPPNINQYPAGSQSYGNEAAQNYAPRSIPGGQPPQQYPDPQQNYASQPQPATTNQQELIGHMKDLQLISFE